MRKEDGVEPVQLFEAWKRALDATIEVPDCEPAINALRGGLREIRRGWRRLSKKEEAGFVCS